MYGGHRDSEKAFEHGGSLVSKTHSQHHQHEISLRDVEIAKLGERWRLELDILYARQVEKDETIATLEAEIQGLREALDARNARELARNDPRGDFESLLIQRIHRLDQKVHNQERLLGFCKDRGGRQSRDWSLTNQEVDQAIDNIGFALESILLGHDMGVSVLASKPVANSDLASLIRPYLQCVGAPSDGQSVIENFTSNCDLVHLIRVLTLVALREWVFNTDFPNFTNQDSPFLQRVRKNIMTFGKLSAKFDWQWRMTDLLRLLEGDWHTLHNIDKASYHQLIQGLTIEDGLNGPEGSIPRKSHHFADRL